jgi:phage FluMu protein Com
MTKCPYCGKEVKELRYVEEALSLATYDGKNYMHFDLIPLNNYWYECPHCHKTIARTQDEAYEFLQKGEEE